MSQTAGPHTIAFLGLPKSGKTTWLGRLWLAIDRPSLDQVQLLQKSGQPDLDALNALADPFIDAKYPAPTSFHNPPRIRTPLKWTGRRDEPFFDVVIADYSGEEVKAIHKERDPAWSTAWEERAQAASVAIFIRPEHHIRPTSTRLVKERMLSSLEQAGRAASRLTDSEGGNLDGWLVVPTAVAIVELLQFFRFLRGWAPGWTPDPEQFRVAVLLSCWDAVPENQRAGGPAGYMRDYLGLLDDFLSTNFKPEGVRAFGVSSTGGDLTEPGFKDTYLQKYPEDWGSVSWNAPSGVRESVDLALPLAWLLVGEEALP